NGAAKDLVFTFEELQRIEGVLKADEAKSRGRQFSVFQAADDTQLAAVPNMPGNHPITIVNEFKVVHFTGHFNQKELMYSKANRPVMMESLKRFVERALVVLDGCSSSGGLAAWTDVYNLSAYFVERGAAVGCIAPVLPVKHDPIV